MLEIKGKIEKIEKSKITNVVDIFILGENNQIKIKLELVKKINPFKESDPVKIIFDTKPKPEQTPKMILNGFIYSITTKEGVKKIDINIGGLRLLIDAPESFDDLTAKSETVIHFF
ncbi:MAG: DNA-directed RNA polymerase subunit G [Candidatus Helarchaeota archaeon]|nr:DNA-directed RNA polymerase subunit G [Candidatus Helarchaeota archaeon]